MEKQKECFKCHLVKDLSDFYKHPQMGDGHVNKCKDCNKIENKENWHDKREEKREYDIYRHRHSIQRQFDHRYNLMKQRCTKIHRKNYTVYGMKILSKKDWNKWCYEKENYKIFMALHNIWVQSDFSRKLCPSIDRINNKRGYELRNLQWLTLSENSKKHTK